MYVDDHAPPHFHAHYQGYRSMWSIEDVSILAGKLPPRIETLVRWWALERKEELKENWTRCENAEQPQKIPPL